jgi:phytanoyl-CoA hydroxylase
MVTQNELDLESLNKHLKAINEDGITVIRGCNEHSICNSVISDYEEFSDKYHDCVLKNLDAFGHEKRLVNFHLISDAAKKIATNEKVMMILDALFGNRASIYTSLTFKYGTQQPVHRDTPHFATWPRRKFVGVWTALEDINPKAGPLFYYPKAHNFELDPRKYMLEAKERLPNSSQKDQLYLALDLYNGEIINTAPLISSPVEVDMKAGDTVIWHPELPHGGKPVIDNSLTRWSIVFHCAPEDIQVHQHDAFFQNYSDTPPPKRYGFTSFGDRKIALAGEVAFM